MCLLLKSGFHLATLPYRPDWWSTAEMVVLLEGSPLFTVQRCSSVRVTIRFLVTSSKALLPPRSLSLARRPALERVLVVPNFFHLWMMEATVLIGTFNAADIFLYPSTDLCHNQFSLTIPLRFNTNCRIPVLCEIEGNYLIPIINISVIFTQKTIANSILHTAQTNLEN